jgi:hypothetical protein
VIISGCSQKLDLEVYQQELLDLNEKMRSAHLEGDIETVTSINAYPYVKVNRGSVTHPTQGEQSERFREYLTSMKITAWDDLIEPIVIISDDASLATVIYRKLLVMVPVGQPASEPYEGIFAWQSTYRRTSEGWRQISDVLTTLPEMETIEELESLRK